MKLDSLEKLFVEQLKDMHSAESQLLEALPRLAEAASAEKLGDVFQKHATQTADHIDRIDRICDSLEFSPRGERCEAMAGLIREAKEIINNDADDQVRDAALICIAQKIEHYEIASYGCLRAFASTLGRDRDAETLGRTLHEERDADHALNAMAMRWVNQFAKSGA